MSLSFSNLVHGTGPTKHLEAETIASSPSLRPPLGIGVAFVSHSPTELVVEESSRSGFTVRRNDEKNVILSVHSPSMSFSDRKEFMTPNGELLFTLRSRMTLLLKQYYLEWPNSEEFMSIDAKLRVFQSEMAVTFRNLLHNGEQVVLRMLGDFNNRNVNIMWDDTVIAGVKRERHGMFSSKHTYYAQVAPQVDLALVAALCVVFHVNVQRKAAAGSNAAAASAASC